jgi:hypothetical protein
MQLEKSTRSAQRLAAPVISLRARSSANGSRVSTSPRS